MEAAFWIWMMGYLFSFGLCKKLDWSTSELKLLFWWPEVLGEIVAEYLPKK